MKLFKEYLLEQKLSMNLWHGSKKKFLGKFDESKIGLGNDEGFSGRGFYFFANVDDVKFAIGPGGGFMREFLVTLNKPLNLDKNDIFSENPPKGMTYSEFRDLETLKLLKAGYDGAYRTLNSKLEEICVFSYKEYGYDGNRKIKPVGPWKKVNK